MPTPSQPSVHIQTYFDGVWHDAAQVTFDDPSEGSQSPSRIEYDTDYFFGGEAGSIYEPAVSVRHPLSLDAQRLKAWPAFLLDIIPAGAAARFWARRLFLQGPHKKVEHDLLTRATVSPVGHMRVRESVRPLEGKVQKFERHLVTQRNPDFLEYANKHGAAIGGGTGAGGDAAKVLLAESDDGLLTPDAVLPDEEVRRHWFVKYPRGEATPSDCLVLRAECSYLKGAAWLGLDTVGPPALEHPKGGKPSLWLPRFDRLQGPDGRLVRVPVESFYSLAGISLQGAHYDHLGYLAAWAALLKEQGQARALYPSVLAYLKLDLLNYLLGNTDNHGRNVALTRAHDELKLAPFYDIAPMALDPSGVARSTTWPSAVELDRKRKWRAVCDLLKPWAKPQRLWDDLREWSQRLRELPLYLLDHQLPKEVYDADNLHLNKMERTLHEHQLL